MYPCVSNKIYQMHVATSKDLGTIIYYLANKNWLYTLLTEKQLYFHVLWECDLYLHSGHKP